MPFWGPIGNDNADEETGAFSRILGHLNKLRGGSEGQLTTDEKGLIAAGREVRGQGEANYPGIPSLGAGMTRDEWIAKGKPSGPSEEEKIARRERYISAMDFARNHPALSEYGQGPVNFLRNWQVPGNIFKDKYPGLTDYASEAANRGRLEAENKRKGLISSAIDDTEY